MNYETDSEYMERKVLSIIENEDGLTDKDIAARLNTRGFSGQAVFSICRQLDHKGFIKRKRSSGGMTNYLRPSVDGRPIRISESAVAEQMILSMLSKDCGLTDGEIKDKLSGRGISNLIIQELCKQLAYKGITKRIKAKGEPIRNILT